MHAADGGRGPPMERLLAERADPDARTADGATALFIAVVRGRAALVAVLREAGADPWLEGPDGRTAAAAARAGGDPALIAALRLPDPGEVFPRLRGLPGDGGGPGAART